MMGVGPREEAHVMGVGLSLHGQSSRAPPCPLPTATAHPHPLPITQAWCYHKGDPALNVAADACPNHHNTWSDCGKGGITPEACRAKGCCWDTTSPRAFCYHKGKLERPTMSW